MNDIIQQNNQMTSGTETDRVMMQVQAQVMMAKKFPRDVGESREKILSLCQNPKLASIATYSYDRGETNIERPSIQLAKAMAVAWKNLEYNWYEISRRRGTKQVPGESHITVYCWDLENNTRPSRTFIVRHWRDTRSGGYSLTDERDIYEVCANMAARRMRECILDIFPKDIEDDAVQEVKKTMARAMGDGSADTLAVRAQNLLKKFEGIGVTRAMFEKRLGKSIESMIMPDLLKYQGIFMTLNDGEQSIESVFPSNNGNGISQTSNSNGNSKDKRPLPGKKNGKGAAPKTDPANQTGEIDWSLPADEAGLRAFFNHVCEKHPDKAEELKVFEKNDPIQGRPLEFYDDFVDGMKRIVNN